MRSRAAGRALGSLPYIQALRYLFRRQQSRLYARCALLKCGAFLFLAPKPDRPVAYDHAPCRVKCHPCVCPKFALLHGAAPRFQVREHLTGIPGLDPAGSDPEWIVHGRPVVHRQVYANLHAACRDCEFENRSGAPAAMAGQRAAVHRGVTYRYR